tara:strand:- start:4199 stop:4489 length:291 start_codon:yes stop_codon:yes gene_type:complete
MIKGKVKKLSTQKQIDLVRDKLLDLMESIRDDVEVPNFIYSAIYTVTELTYDTAPNPYQAQLLMMNSIMANLEHREDIDEDPYVTKLQKKRGKNAK